VRVSVSPAKALRGEISLPGDKSITHRAMMLGAISTGMTEIHGFSSARDPLSTLSCLQSLGVQTRTSGNVLHIHGKGLRQLSKPAHPLDAGNSGTTIRLLTGILAAQKFDSTIAGDDSLNRRPMKRIIEPLTSMGAKIESSDKQTPPLHIHPVTGLRAIEYKLPVASAQVKSCIIFAALHADGKTRIFENLISRDHTERMLGLEVLTSDGSRVIEVEGQKEWQARKHFVPGDVSAAAYFIVGACLVPNSELLLKNVGLNPTRTMFLEILREMGGRIEVMPYRADDPEPRGDIVVRSSPLKNILILPEWIPQIIDEIPILAIAGAIAEGPFELRGASELRVKESDRILSLCRNLRDLGVEVEEYADGFALEGKNHLIPKVSLQSYGDHRIAMAMGIGGLVAASRVEILDAECVDISFPGFWSQIQKLSR
jgi:3-phosphoshikimate 1-carboxyvinyltransferase